MTLKFIEKKEFSGDYNTTTMLIYTDTEIEQEKLDLINKILKLYQGHNGEVIEYKLLFDDKEVIYKIIMVIICFNTLLADVSKRDYLKFIEMHSNQFMEYYTKVFGK